MISIMPDLSVIAILCSVRSHGEHGAIVRMMTREAGLIAAYVRGAKSRQIRPILIAGNVVMARLRIRNPEQLAGAAVELIESRAPLLSEPLASAAIDWVTIVTAVSLAENQPCPALFETLSAILDAIVAAPTARSWAAALAGFELLMLDELGFGLNLSQCAATGRKEDLSFVSLKSGAAVSRAAGAGLETHLLPLPPFLRGEGRARNMSDALAALHVTGHFIARSLTKTKYAELTENRQRLIARLQRASA